MTSRWRIWGSDPENFFGLRLQCLLVRNKNNYAIRFTNLRVNPLLNLRVMVNVRLFDDDGRTEYFNVKDVEIQKINAFESVDIDKSCYLEDAVYSVDCQYLYPNELVFKESFYFDVNADSFNQNVSSLHWRVIYFYEHFGNKCSASLTNQTVGQNKTVTGDGKKLDMSCILVLGPDSNSYITRLKKIQEAISLLGYNSILVREQKEFGHETVEQKLLRLALSSRFVLVEDSIAAGQIDELSLIARSRITVAVLREHGKGGTWMQSDYDLDFPVKYFNYYVNVPTDLYQAVSKAVEWADERNRNRSKLLGERYPWR